MVIKGEDNRSIVTNFNVDGFNAVVGVDVPLAIPRINSEVITDSGTGSLVSPYHVLTAGHVIFSTPQASQAKVRLGENAAALSSRTRTPLSSENFDASGANFSYPVQGYNGGTGGNDLGLITLNESIGESSQYIGLAAFVDPQDAKDLQVTTAGFPGVVEIGDFATNEDGSLNVEDSTSKNAQFLITDENNAPSEFLQRLNGREFYITDAVKMFTATGTIDSVDSEGQLNFSATLDGEAGQSGSGYWTYLEGDSEPRVLGVYSGDRSTGSPFFNSNIGALITTEAYDNIVATMQPLLETNKLTGNDLPENAIIGSSENDNIVGSYRRERILGNDGNDTILGGEADDRLEGGTGNDVLSGGKDNDLLQGDEGNDFLGGGEGEQDIAVFSDDYTTENYDYSEIEEGIVTFEHIGGTQTDGKDTLEGIEWAQFGGNSADGVSGPPRIIPLPLEDGVLKTTSLEVGTPPGNHNPNDPPTPPHVALELPVSMLDGDADYTLNISPYQPNFQYNIAYIIDTSASMDAAELQTVKKDIF